MRTAFAVAITAACLVATSCPAATAGDTDIVVSGASYASLASDPYDRSVFHADTRIASRLFNFIELDATYGQQARGLNGGKLRLKSWSMLYRPFGTGFRLFAGARKDKLPKLSRALSADRGTSTGANFMRRSFSPGVGVGYDLKLDGSARFALDASMARNNRDPNLRQLFRLAGMADRDRLSAAPNARFGPSLRLTLTRAF